MIAGLRVLVADDEPLARDRLRRLLRARPRCELVTECDDGTQAARTIPIARPDVVFLDIRMPGLDGLAVAEAVRGLGPAAPLIVFVTAFEEYALAAIESGAIDYLVKPIDPAKLDRALGRAESWLRDRKAHPELLSLLERIAPPPGEPSVRRLAIRDASGTYFVAVDDVDWIEADGNYVRLHVGRSSHLLRDTIERVAAKLSAAHFVRIHRSVIVNADRVARIQAHAHGEYIVILADGTRVTSSRAYNQSIRALLA